MSKDIRTKAYVLRRTNYGESDRILNLLTESGYISAIAKGVRKEKSKLAGGIELFCLSDLTLHEGKNNSLYTLTSSRMLEYYDKIPIDLKKLELASVVLKNISRVAESSDGSVYFDLVRQTLRAINIGIDLNLIELWFWFNFAKASGEEINLIRDVSGLPLAKDITYVWDVKEKSLRPQMGGFIGEDEIKLMRFLLSSRLNTVSRLEKYEHLLPPALFIAKSVNGVK